MKGSDEVISLDFIIHESREGLEQKNEYDHDFLRKLIDNSVINTFGILEASKIQYELILKNPPSKEFQMNTTKKHLCKVLTGVVLINSNTEEDLRIKLKTLL